MSSGGGTVESKNDFLNLRTIHISYHKNIQLLVLNLNIAVKILISKTLPGNFSRRVF
jgi:hypothetical protein